MKGEIRGGEVKEEIIVAAWEIVFLVIDTCVV